MEKTLIKTRRFNKETYEIYLCTPSYDGELGCCGLEIEPYVQVKAPENCFGYDDTILFNSIGYGYSLNRCYPNWIMRELEKINRNILKGLQK